MCASRISHTPTNRAASVVLERLQAAAAACPATAPAPGARRALYNGDVLEGTAAAREREMRQRDAVKLLAGLQAVTAARLRPSSS